MLLGDNNGNFTLQTKPAYTGTAAYNAPFGLVVVDVNGDGKLDALTANSYASTVGVLLGNGSGGFTLQTPLPYIGNNSRPVSLAVADVNGDGKLDLLTADYNASKLVVFQGDGSGHFTLQANSPSTGVDTQPVSMVVVDINGDGKPDVLTTNDGSSALSILLNTTGSPLPTRAALPGSRVSVYPNPAHATATLFLTGLPSTATQVQVTLLDATGRAVAHHMLSVTGGSLPLAGLAAGLYVVRMTAQDAGEQTLGELPAQRLSVW